MMTPDQIAEQAAHWIAQVQKVTQEKTRGLTAAERAMFQPFFQRPPTDVLDRVRVCEVTQVPAPPLAEWELPADTLDPSDPARTYQDIIFITPAAQHPPAPWSFEVTLFHELVHVVQYEQLGVLEFARLYLNGIKTGRVYAAYPLEAMAFLLQGWFQAKAWAPFSIPAEVVRALSHLR